MSRNSLFAPVKHRPRRRSRREYLKRFFKPRAEHLEKRLLLANDVFPMSHATVTLRFGDPFTGPTEVVDLTGPTEVFRDDVASTLPGRGDPTLEDVGLRIQVLDLSGNHPNLGAVSLGLPQRGSVTFGAPSSGFAEEKVNDVPLVLEEPLRAEFLMFVEVNAMQSDPPFRAINQQPIVMRADLSQVPPAPGEAFQSIDFVELFDATTSQRFDPPIYVTQVTHIVQPINLRPNPLDVTVDLAENSANGTTVHSFDPNDPNAGDTHTCSIIGGNDQNIFGILPNTCELVVEDNTHLDHEWFPLFELEIQVTDNGDLSGAATVTVNLTDQNDGPVAQDDNRYLTNEDTIYSSDITAANALVVEPGFDLFVTPDNPPSSTAIPAMPALIMFRRLTRQRPSRWVPPNDRNAWSAWPEPQNRGSRMKSSQRF